MRKLLLGALLLLSTLSFGQSKSEMLAELNGQYNQDENGNVTIVKVIDLPGLKKDEIYVRTLSYFTYNYTSGKSVIQLQEKENGLIIGKGLYENVHVGAGLVTTEVSAWHVIRIDIKDEKVRIIVTLTQYDKKIIGGNTPPLYLNRNIKDEFPINPKGSQETVMTKAFYKSTKKVFYTIDSIEKSIKEGNTNSTETKGW
jgi:hypothetical protein